MNRRAAALIAASMLAVGFSGCSGNGDTTDTSDSGFVPSMDTNAQAVIDVNGSWSNFQALESAAANWNKIYPNVEINYVKIDSYNSMLSKLTSGDSRPEIVMFDLSSYYEEKDSIIGNLTDLSDIGLDLAAVNSSAVSSQTYDGKLCSLPWGVLATGFVANTTLLDSLGLEIPTTHDEMMETFQTLVDNGYTPVQGCTNGFYQNLMNNDMKYKVMHVDDYQALHDSLANVTAGCSSVFADEFTEMLELTEKNYVSAQINDSITDNYEGNILHFFEGNTPFLCFNTEGFSGMKKRESKSEKFTAEPFEYEFVALPICTNEPTLSMGFLPGLSIVSGSENEEWAKEFLRFVCSSELNEMAEVKGVPTTAVSGESDPRFSHIGMISGDMTVVPYEDVVSALSDETFAFTLENIAEGNVTDIAGAYECFENHLGGMR